MRKAGQLKRGSVAAASVSSDGDFDADLNAAARSWKENTACTRIQELSGLILILRARVSRQQELVQWIPDKKGSSRKGIWSKGLRTVYEGFVAICLRLE